MRLLMAMTMLAVTLFLLPSAAGAKGRSVVTGPRQAIEFQLRGSHGYSIYVFASGRQVSLTAQQGSSSASYSTPGTVSPEKIEAKFGGLGHISVQFHADGRPRKEAAERGCRGKKGTVDSGAWVGRVDFRGEQGFTAVHAVRGRGKIVKTPKRTCKQEDEEGGLANIRWTNLEAIAKSGAFVTASRIEFQERPALDGSLFFAAIVELHGRDLSVFRSISTEAPIDAFTLTEEGGNVISATISPPAPFKGTGTFQRTTGSKGSWSGSLVGDFPGHKNVVLAGPKFSAGISELGG
jgi:hypothetical protein